jgi:hypothetical protein
VGWVLLAVVIIFALIGFAVYQSVQEEQRVVAARAESERQSAIEAQRVEEQKAAEEARVKAAEEARLKAAAPSATIARVWIDHNVFEGSEKGMRVHLSFTVNNLNGSQCQALLLYFFDDGTPEGSPIVNGKARCWLTGTEQLCGVTAFTPRFPQAEFSDLLIFVPSNDLFSVSGDHSKFKVKAQIQQVGGARLAVTDWFFFETQQTP